MRTCGELVQFTGDDISILAPFRGHIRPSHESMRQMTTERNFFKYHHLVYHKPGSHFELANAPHGNSYGDCMVEEGVYGGI